MQTKPVISLFQFRYGTIKSFPHYSPKLLLTYFNSAMVQLKDPMATEELIKVDYFNSAMVQLKVSRSRGMTICKTPFQFRYGTIKSGVVPVADSLLPLISIPLWYN